MCHPPSILIGILASVVISSCSNPTGPGYTSTEMTFQFERETFRTSDTTTVIDRVSGGFFRPEEVTGDGQVTSVWLNDFHVPRVGDTLNFWMEQPGPVLPLAFDGGFHRVRINGAGIALSVDDSLRSPRAPLQMTTPLVGDTVSRSRGFTVRWQPIAVTPTETLITYEAHDENWNGFSGGFKADNGTLSFTPEFLAQTDISFGPIDIAISRYATRDTVTPDNRRYALRLVSTDRVRVVFVE